MHYGWMDFASIGRLLAWLRPTMTSRHPACTLTADGGLRQLNTTQYMDDRKL